MYTLFYNNTLVLIFDKLYFNCRCKEELIHKYKYTLFLSKDLYSLLIDIFRNYYRKLPSRKQYENGYYFFGNDKNNLLNYNDTGLISPNKNTDINPLLETIGLSEYELTCGIEYNSKHLSSEIESFIREGYKIYDNNEKSISYNISEIIYLLYRPVWYCQNLIIDFPVFQTEKGIVFCRKTFSKEDGFTLRNIIDFIYIFYNEEYDNQGKLTFFVLNCYEKEETNCSFIEFALQCFRDYVDTDELEYYKDDEEIYDISDFYFPFIEEFKVIGFKITKECILQFVIPNLYYNI